jgi:sugar phosphate isomerase/epimerase
MNRLEPSPSDADVRSVSLAVSLRWNVHSTNGVDAAIQGIVGAGFGRVELCGLDEAECLRWPTIAISHQVTAVSMHAPCPDCLDRNRRVPGDWLVDPDPDLRAAAVAGAVNSVRMAAHLGIERVAFHLGTLGLVEEYRRLLHAVTNATPDANAARDAYRRLRDRKARECRPWLLSAIDTILDATAGQVAVCVENRYRFDQLPNLDDVMTLFDRYLPGSGLSYWHDTGHEAAQCYLGLWNPDQFAIAVERVAGLHVHDCVEVDDHRCPGDGVYPFGRLRPLLRPDLPVVIEPNPKLSAQDLRNGARHLMAILTT